MGGKNKKKRNKHSDKAAVRQHQKGIDREFITQLSNESTLLYVPPSHIVEVSGFRVVEVPGDGNCLFHAIADQLNHSHVNEAIKVAENYNPENTSTKQKLSNTRWNAESVRSRVMSSIESHQSFFRGFVKDEDVVGYVQKMKQPGVWGGQVELLAASFAFRTDVHVHRRGQEVLVTTYDPGCLLDDEGYGADAGDAHEGGVFGSREQRRALRKEKKAAARAGAAAKVLARTIPAEALIGGGDEVQSSASEPVEGVEDAERAEDSAAPCADPTGDHLGTKVNTDVDVDVGGATDKEGRGDGSSSGSSSSKGTMRPEVASTSRSTCTGLFLSFQGGCHYNSLHPVRIQFVSPSASLLGGASASATASHASDTATSAATAVVDEEAEEEAPSPVTDGVTTTGTAVAVIDLHLHKGKEQLPDRLWLAVAILRGLFLLLTWTLAIAVATVLFASLHHLEQPGAEAETCPWLSYRQNEVV